MKPMRSPRAGLVSFDEPKAVVLPLKGVLVEFVVAGGVAEVTMVQAYLQENDRPLNCRYLFPLPTDAAVFACEIEVDGRRLVARVEEKERALALAREAWQAGHRTVLVEPERENLFTLSLGNVQPGDFVEVRLRYVQPLRRIGEVVSLEIPFNPGVRYIPGRPLLRSNRGPGVVDDTDEVPDASRISPPRIDPTHPDAAFVDVQGRIEAAYGDPASVTSLSHEIVVTHEEGWAQVTLRRHGELLDRGLVLRWNEPPPGQAVARAWTRRRGDDTYALVEIRAPRSAAAAEDAPARDVYFLVDQSGSMAGPKWTQAIAVMQTLVAGLRDQDRVMVTLFQSVFHDFAEAPLPKPRILADSAFGALGKLGTGGGTEMVPAIEHVLGLWRRHSAGRPSDLVLITDAEIGNEASVVQLVKDATELTVHTIGVADTANDHLLHACARLGHGTFHALHPRDDLPALAEALRSVLGAPVWRGIAVGDGAELSGPIPDLHAGQVHYASVRCHGAELPKLRALDSQGRSVGLEFVSQPAPGDAPYLQWVRSRIRTLLDGAGNEAEAVRWSCEANVICPRTAFVAWDEASRVPIAGEHLVQPNLEGLLVSESRASDEYMRYSVSMCRHETLSEDFDPTGPRRARVTTQFDRKRRREQLSKWFQDLRRRGGIPEGEEAFERLLDWAEGAETDREGEDRFAEVQALLMEFRGKVEAFERRVRLLGHFMGGFEAELSGALERLREFMGKPPSEEFGVAMDRRLGRVNSAGKQAIEWQRGFLQGQEELRQWLRGLPERLPVTPPPTPASPPAPVPPSGEPGTQIPV